MQSALRALPATYEDLFVGVDIGKSQHYAAFTNRALSRGGITKVPTHPFDQTRHGFESLLVKMDKLCPLDRCVVLLEVTGHYHLPLLLFLLEHGLTVYLLQSQVKSKKQKTDKRDAQMLANVLFNQAGLGVQVEEAHARIRPVASVSPTANYLRLLTRRRTELSIDQTRHRNRLTAICDELFPEFTEIIKDPNGKAALQIRQAYPTPELIAAADFEALRKCQAANHPGRAKLARLQELASASIGTRDEGRIAGLCITQHQMIDGLRILDNQIAQLDSYIADAIKDTRERTILASFGVISPLHQAVIIAYVGDMSRFADKAAVKGYAGWHPRQQQSGSTLDKTSLARSGNRSLRQAIYLTTWHAIRTDSVWKELYQRLFKKFCIWDARKQEWRGKNKVLARLASQMLGVIFSLLKADYELLQSIPIGEEPPPPQLYDRSKHASHIKRHGLKAL